LKYKSRDNTVGQLVHDNNNNNVDPKELAHKDSLYLSSLDGSIFCTKHEETPDNQPAQTSLQDKQKPKLAIKESPNMLMASTEKNTNVSMNSRARSRSSQKKASAGLASPKTQSAVFRTYIKSTKVKVKVAQRSYDYQPDTDH
jgi:hypothetical protein